MADFSIFLATEMLLLELEHVILCIKSMFRLGNQLLVDEMDVLLVKNEPGSRQYILPKNIFLYHLDGAGKKCFMNLKIV